MDMYRLIGILSQFAAGENKFKTNSEIQISTKKYKFDLFWCKDDFINFEN
jgi:hypothetical protein